MKAWVSPKLALAASILAGAGCMHDGAKVPTAADSRGEECPASIRYAPVGTPTMSLASLQDLAAARLAPLGLEAVWQAPEGASFQDVPQDRERLRNLLSVVLPAYERYPRSLLTRVGLRRLEFVKDLCVAGNYRVAMPAVQRDSVAYADIGLPPGRCPAGLEARAHHELYHLIEARLFGDYYHRDPQWLALNPPGVEYGAGGRDAYGERPPEGVCRHASSVVTDRSGTQRAFFNAGHPHPGMVSAYAMYGPEEDKAEVFGWMMTPGYASRVKQWVQGDPALAAKRRFMVRLVEDLSGGELGAAAVDAIAALPAP